MDFQKTLVIILFRLWLVNNDFQNETGLVCYAVEDRKNYHSEINIQNVTYLAFYSFKSFQEIELNCSNKYSILEIRKLQSSLNIVFVPSDSLLIEKSFTDFLSNSFDKMNLIMFEESIIILQNIKGIQNDLFFPNEYLKNAQLILTFSIFDFYHFNEKVSNKAMCGLVKGFNSFFTQFFTLMVTKAKYPEFLCPNIFHMSSLIKLTLNDISNSLLFKNRINILEYSFSDEKKSSLQYLEINFYNEELNTRLLSKQMFINVKNIWLMGKIERLEVNVFDGFELKRLKFSLENLKDFFHSTSKSWTTFLNKNTKNNSNIYSNFLLVSFDFPKRFGSFNEEYTYPDEDFCLFAEYPNDRLVFYHIVSNEILECSCTQRFLMRKNEMIKDQLWSNKLIERNEYSFYYNYVFISNFNSTYEYCRSDFYNTTPSFKCDFTKMASLCNQINFLAESPTKSFLNNDTDVYFLILWLQFILLVIANPILCCLSVITNSLTIIVICNKSKKKDFKDQMYKLMILNAMFNIFFCLISITKLGNECIYYYWSIFCSSVYQSVFMQYFKIIVVDFLGNTIRTCCGLSYLAFSLSRFILISDDLKKNKFLVKFSKIKIKNLLILFLILSCLVSCYKLFQFKINEIHLPLRAFPYEIYDQIDCKTTSDFRCKLFDALKSIDVLLNDLIFLILLVILDVFLFKKFRQEMEAKRNTFTSMKNEEIDKKQDDVIKMIVTNGLVYFLSHLPVFFTSILLVAYAKKIEKFCTYKFSCDLINEISKFFCVISMFLQFFIYLRFNKNFKKSLSDVKKKIFRSN